MVNGVATINIEAELAYDFAERTDVLLQLEAALIPEQTVEKAYIDISPVEHFARVPGHDTIGDRIWLRLQGQLRVRYTATVAIHRLSGELHSLAVVPPHQLPGETVQYMLPSRYCPSDQFQNFVDAQFGGLVGGARVAAMCDWVQSHCTYQPGVSTSATTALESFVMRQGVCRDFAHLLISLVRASAIPARFASVYALGVEPQDFHAVPEVFLGGAWYLVDPTGMAQAEEMAKIGVGRDAADVSFLTSYGWAELNHQSVRVTRN
ncbi:transglutaminase family protein [Novosphingobium sp. PS1R-30]|jgi:transglutaminase-like putative cysteine protease|uniref:Transglutaminase family protein n=1 Tax=Novosphingobium anseongense TaxID=3133436 RepID=A0ABU8RZL7_9SPHN|nr:MAG: transglutaminase family protein [Novosphingobium sp.]